MDARLAPHVTERLLRAVVSEVPEAWLGEGGPELVVEDLLARVTGPRGFVEEAERARTA
jgi:hypothetical protein